MNAQDKDYKVEMKPTYWEVVISSGEYSYYSEKHLFFAGNDEDEVWNFLCRYIDDTDEESDCLFGVSGDCHALKRSDGKQHLSAKYTGDKEDVGWSNEYRTCDVTISRLNIIYFKS